MNVNNKLKEALPKKILLIKRLYFPCSAKIYFARMLFCSLKNALQYSLAKCSPKKMLFMKRAFNEESILTKNIGEHFEKPREHSLKNALLHTFDAAL